MTLLSLERESESVASICQVTMMVPRAGFEPATTRSSAERSPRLSYLGAFWKRLCFLGEAIKSVSWTLIYVFVERSNGANVFLD